MQYSNLTKKWRRSAFICGILTAMLALCIWLFGWGRGNIEVIDFSAEEVEYVRLGCAQLYAGGSAVVREPTEIQALIDAINAFQNTGSSIKWVFRYGVFVGGSVLYEHTFYLKNGDNFSVVFASNESSQLLSDMDLKYWIIRSNGEQTNGSTCRGSLEVFSILHKKYLPYE